MAEIKKQTNLLVYIGIGCVALLFLVGAGMSIFFKFFAKKAMEGVIQNKTGIDVSDVEKGKMTFTDTKTGAKVDIGGGKLPDNFPKDFPIYPGAKVTSVLSGAQSGKENGFWLTLSATDTADKVASYYKSQLPANGWEISMNYTAGDTTTFGVSKTGWSGSVAITPGQNKEVNIVILLGQDENK